MMHDSLTIAISKGRIYDQALPLLAAAGIQPTADAERTRKLILSTNVPQLQLVIIRATDVPTYVQYGAADLGIAGKDVLLEHGSEGLYEPLDLGIARCRLMVAGRPEHRPEGRRIRVATKFVNVARRFFASQGRQADVIKLYGSMELAPLVGLADYIVDLVDTGNTLRANGLQPLETIAEVSARLVVNEAAAKIKHRAVRGLLRELSEAVAAPTPG